MTDEQFLRQQPRQTIFTLLTWNFPSEQIHQTYDSPLTNQSGSNLQKKTQTDDPQQSTSPLPLPLPLPPIPTSTSATTSTSTSASTTTQLSHAQWFRLITHTVVQVNYTQWFSLITHTTVQVNYRYAHSGSV